MQKTMNTIIIYHTKCKRTAQTKTAYHTKRRGKYRFHNEQRNNKKKDVKTHAFTLYEQKKASRWIKKERREKAIGIENICILAYTQKKKNGNKTNFRNDKPLKFSVRSCFFLCIVILMWWSADSILLDVHFFFFVFVASIRFWYSWGKSIPLKDKHKKYYFLSID